MTTAPLRVAEDDLDFDDNHRYVWEGEPFTGIGYEEQGGQLISEAEYRDGYQDGPSREWYPSGVVKSEKAYRYSTAHGVFSSYDEEGHLKERKLLEYGIPVWSESFAADGSLQERTDIDETDSRYQLLQKYRRERAWEPTW